MITLLYKMYVTCKETKIAWACVIVNEESMNLLSSEQWFDCTWFEGIAFSLERKCNDFDLWSKMAPVKTNFLIIETTDNECNKYFCCDHQEKEVDGSNMKHFLRHVQCVTKQYQIPSSVGHT